MFCSIEAFLFGDGGLLYCLGVPHTDVLVCGGRLRASSTYRLGSKRLIEWSRADWPA
jgi:hypothetical protein